MALPEATEDGQDGMGTGVDARMTAEYIKDMLESLKRISDKSEFRVLSHLLDAARREAEIVLRELV